MPVYLQNGYPGIMAALISLPLSVFLICLIIYFSAIWINSFKWHILLKRYRILDLFYLNLIGSYYALLLPGQLAGKIIKAYRLGSGKTDAEQIAASVMIDRATGVIGLILVGIGGLMLTETSLIPNSFRWTLFVAIFVCLLALYSIHFNFAVKFIKKKLDFTVKKFPGLHKLIDQLHLFIAEWKKYLNNPSILIVSVVIGMVFQLVTISIAMILAKSLHVDVSYPDWCWVIAIMSMAVFLPITIGGMGLREGTLVALLGWLGVPGEQALALSFSIFAMILIGAAIGGFIDFFDAPP
jgi:uncharacterized protein (TIRG00374 family)